MNPVFTVYCCGTAYDHASGDLIAKLYDNTTGKLSVDKAIMAGPGSSEISSYYYDPIPVVEQEEPSFLWSLGSSVLNTTASVVMWAPYQVSTKVSLGTGHQMSCNVQHLMTALERESKLPGTINLVGWSRGAVTCHKMANALSKVYGTKIKVNIFSIDPVPGVTNFGEDEVSIPDNVQDFVSVMSLNENRSIMTTTDLKIGKKTRAVSYVFPGVHSTPVDGGPQEFCKGVYRVVRHMAEEFLYAHGTRFSARKALSPRQICEQFASMLLDWKKFKLLGSSSRLTSSHTGYGGLRSRLSSGHFFVNDYHKAAFQEAYPELYERLQAILGGSGISSQSSTGLVKRRDRLGDLLSDADEKTRTALAKFEELRESASEVTETRVRPLNLYVGSVSTSVLQQQVTKKKTE